VPASSRVSANSLATSCAIRPPASIRPYVIGLVARDLCRIERARA
jgi:hypothetical protein